MLKSLLLWTTRQRICSRCHRVVKKSEFRDDEYRKKPWNLCSLCQAQIKVLVKKPKASWNGMKHYRDRCPYCKSRRYKQIYEDPIDHTGNVYKCFRCRNKFMGYQLDDMYDRASKHPLRRPKPTKTRNVAQLKCWMCNRVFRQDNHKFKESGRCPSCGYFNLQILRYVSQRRVKK